MKESELEFYIIIKDRKMEISQQWYRDTLLTTNMSPPVVGKIYIQYTLQETNISPKNGILKMIFLFSRWDMLIPWRVFLSTGKGRVFPDTSST